MAKKGSEKKRKNKKKEEKLPKITKSEYLKRIAEKNAILAEARKHSRFVEDTYIATENKYEQTQEDMVDIIKYLQHEIEENEKEIEEFNAKINEYSEDIKKNDLYYESIFNKMEMKYNEKHKALQNQIQLSTAKLLASEEVRQLREDYLRKKEELSINLQEMQTQHEQEIYEAEKSAIIKQDTMQKDMEIHVTNLANDFSQATDIAIGETTNKLIRDNITLGNMLTCMQEIIEHARNAYRKAFYSEKAYRYNMELIDDELYTVMQKYIKQGEKVTSLIKSYDEAKERIAASKKLTKENRKLQRQIIEKECILKEKTIQLDELLDVLKEHEDTIENIKNSFNVFRDAVIKLEVCLFEAAKKVKEGIEIENITRLAEQDDAEFEKEEQEELLKEYKYKKREAAIEDVVSKLIAKLKSESSLPVVVSSSESYLNRSFQGSVTSNNPSLRYL